MKYILVAIIAALIYRLFNNNPKIEAPSQELEDDGFAEYEEIE